VRSHRTLAWICAGMTSLALGLVAPMINAEASVKAGASKPIIRRIGWPGAAGLKNVVQSGRAPVSHPAVVADGFVRRSGSVLTLDGAPYRFLGYFENLMSRQGRRCGRAFTDAEVVQAFDELQNVDHVNGLRVWFYNLYGGPGDWARYDLIVRQAELHGIKLVVTLTNQLGDCEPFLDDKNTRDVKHLDWYQSGYRQPHNGNPSGTGGYVLSYRDYVRVLAARYSASPAILAWQLVNEADPQPRDGQSVNPTVCAQALRSWSDDMVTVIKGVDPNHLTSLGTYGAGGCGSYFSKDYRYIHAGKVDLCEYHDYKYPKMAMPGDDTHANLQIRIDDCKADNKPLFIGESGIGVGNGGTAQRAAPDTTTRAADFKAKIDAAYTHGAVGYLIWARQPAVPEGTDPGFYNITPDDPTQKMLSRQAEKYL
jgi:mannan endo-1,4-beta-mannosidase